MKLENPKIYKYGDTVYYRDFADGLCGQLKEHRAKFLFYAELPGRCSIDTGKRVVNLSSSCLYKKTKKWMESRMKGS